MLRRTFLTALAGVAGMAVTSIASTMPAHADQWVLLGQQHVGHNADMDVFHIGGEEGQFRALRFAVTGNRVAVAQVRVFYGNGTSEFLNVTEHVMPGTFTKAYDLAGNYRVIKRIEVLYQSEFKGKGQALFRIYGLRHTAAPGPGPGPAPGGNWVTLGSVVASQTLDHDTIVLGPTAGAFRMIRFHLTHRPAMIYNIRVTFMNGQTQVFNFNKHVAAGAWSVPLDLAGDKRFIARIDVVYQKDPSAPGLAKLTVEGLR